MATDPVLIFFDISIGGKFEGQIVIEVFRNDVPKTASNFISLCKGDCIGKKGKKLHFEGCPIHSVIPGLCLEGGDISMGTGIGGESIYGDEMPVEKSLKKHSYGSLSTAYAVPTSSAVPIGSFFKCEGSQFMICLSKKCPSSFDEDHIVFGEVIHGIHVLDAIEKVGSRSGTTSQEVKIVKCGQLY